MKNILVVDDSSIILTIIVELIENSFPGEFNIVSANTVDSAKEIIDNQKIDLLFQDLHVQNENDGIIVADHAQLVNVPVCIVTAESDFDPLLAIAKKKFEKILMKPITQKGIKNTINELLLHI